MDAIKTNLPSGSWRIHCWNVEAEDNAAAEPTRNHSPIQSN